MRVFAGFCNKNLRVHEKIVEKFLFLLKNIYHIYLAFDNLRIRACLSDADNQQTKLIF